MSAVQVPADLIGHAVDLLAKYASLLHSDYCSESHAPDLVTCPRAGQPTAAAAELRALLPAPAPTCPNCGHDDGVHNSSQCRARDEDDAPSCDCWISINALPQVRSLLAAERDSKPAQRQPRVWQVGDAYPEGVTKVVDSDPHPWTVLRTWVRGDDNRWRLVNVEGEADPSDLGRSWPALLSDYGPLTEVLDGGEPR